MITGSPSGQHDLFLMIMGLGEVPGSDPDGLVSQAQEALAEEEFAARYENGLRQLDSGDWSAAIEAFAGLERERPGYRDTRSLLGQVQGRQDEQRRRNGWHTCNYRSGSRREWGNGRTL
jgi:hypothetical protein